MQSISSSESFKNFSFYPSSSSSFSFSCSSFFFACVFFTHFCFFVFHALALKLYLSVALLAGSGCWAKCEMRNGKWKMRQEGRGGGRTKRKEKLITCVIITQFLLCFFLVCALLCFERSLNFSALGSLKCRLPVPRPRQPHRPPLSVLWRN